MEKCGEFTRNRARRDEVSHCIVEPYKSAAMALAAFLLSFKVKTLKKLKNGTEYSKLCTAQF